MGLLLLLAPLRHGWWRTCATFVAQHKGSVWTVLPVGAISLNETGTDSERKSGPGVPPGFIRRVYHKFLPATRLTASFRYLQSDFATVFMLHRFGVGEPGAAYRDPMLLRRALEYLRRNRFELISLAELFRRLAGQGPRLRGAVAFTIDDGYLDQSEIGGPIFSEFDCPVTTFVTTGFLDGTLWLWWDKIEHVFSTTRCKSVAVSVGQTPIRYELGSGSASSLACADFVERCKLIDDVAKHEAIARLAQEADVDLPDAAPSRYAPMTWDHVRTCEERGMTFGPHTVSHPILSRTQPERAVYEMSESWRRLREEARRPVPIFCYPNGQRADFGDREIAIARELGFWGALSTEAGFADPVYFQRGSDPPFATRRLTFPKDLSVLAQYAGGIERLKQSARGLMT